jgi:DNA-binding MarR family transcriptional regulator
MIIIERRGVSMEQSEASWTFFSNHGHVYFLLASREEIVLREVALRVGITERSVLGIVQDLEEAGYIKREKVGRSNKYKIVTKKTLRHPLECNVQLNDLIKLIKDGKS